jgi:hypothetical protein
VHSIYGGEDINTVKKLLKDNNISYIVIEEANRSGRDKNYTLNESLIQQNFKKVEIQGVYDVDIYKVD